MPPGSAKSTYASILFPAWWFCQHPQTAIIGTSHTAELAERFSRRVRRTIDEHGRALGYGVRGDTRGADRWETTTGGEYRMAGVGGAVTGFRADLAIIDDPVKSREEAYSDTRRERTRDWYRADLLTRLKPGGRVVLIMTRWHEDDLGGTVLDEQPPWRVLRLPALAEANDPLHREPGQPLWPQWQNGAALSRIRGTIGEMDWSALYQQSPSPESGAYFSRDWLRPSSDVPRDLKVYGASDYAVTADGGDWTVHIVVGIDVESRIWALDLRRAQSASDEWVETFCDLVLAWKPLAWAEEMGQIKAGVGPFLTKRQRERRAYVARFPFPTRGDKAIRAQSIRGRMATDGLWYDMNAPWRVDFERELVTFPAGRHDDQVDALGLIGQLLDRMLQPVKPEEPLPMRSVDRMTMTEAWKLGNGGGRAGGYKRI